ncbi:MAG: SDR family NAD(P)-dependent oxidoreductase [Desulfococcaceae bacterium]
MSDQPAILITGASRGMGAAAARWLAGAGAAVSLISRSEEALESVARDVTDKGGRAIAFCVDVAGRGACEAAVQETVRQFGRLDTVVNNAGILEPIGPISEINPHAWSYNIEVNLNGPFFMIQAALPELRKRNGRVINVSSGAAKKVIQGWSAYCAAKAALTHLNRVLAAEEPEITAIALRPGVVDTAMQGTIRENGASGMDAEKHAYFMNLKAEGKLEPPEIPARAIAWLALHAPREWSGEFLEYDDSRIADPAAEIFGRPAS